MYFDIPANVPAVYFVADLYALHVRRTRTKVHRKCQNTKLNINEIPRPVTTRFNYFGC